MPRHRSLLSLVLLLTFASCTAPAKAPEASADPTALQDTIQAREREWSAAYLAGNAAGVAALYTEDAAQVQSSGDWFRGRDAITKGMQAQFDTLAVTAREDITEEVIPAGDYAVEIGHYSTQGTSKADKTPRSSAGRYMVLWRKDGDGVWRLHRDIGSEVPPKKP
ncbi:MAG: SgcJ/EcaC family oxidoreductase [Gemmatimonadota bacterium]|nr:SgcJ/EcaC family oxidoreductase [Gemmatimonadota bacterium]